MSSCSFRCFPPWTFSQINVGPFHIILSFNFFFNVYKIYQITNGFSSSRNTTFSNSISTFISTFSQIYVFSPLITKDSGVVLNSGAVAAVWTMGHSLTGSFWHSSCLHLFSLSRSFRADTIHLTLVTALA